jgi:uncharacterized hydrophobic protein (TIGR00271 family)
MSAAPAIANELLRPPDVVYQEAYEGRQFDAVYFSMMIFACLIALMGLLLNSPAVIIGAMLISPLMGPILACGLALTTAEWSLGRKAARNLALSVAEVIFIATLATLLSPLRDATPEILARTNPNLMDLLVAFFSGLAGTVAMASRKTAFTILPGVAIATAVMPPLATVGYGLATRQWTIASGAFMLFFTNFTAIVLSASLVFLITGVRPQQQRGGETHRLLVRWRIAIAAAVVLVISIPLMRTLTNAAEQANIRNQVRHALTENMRNGSQLDSVRVELDKGAVGVAATVETAQYLEATDIETWRSALQERIGRPVRLEVQQLQLARNTPSAEQVIRDFLAAGAMRPVAPEKPAALAEQIADLQQHLESSLQSLVEPVGVTVHVLSAGKQPDGTVVVTVSAESPAITSEQIWSVAAVGLASAISAPVRIEGTVAATGIGVVLAYRHGSVEPSAAGRQLLRRFGGAVPKEAGVAFAASAEMEQGLAQRRIAVLRRVVARDIANAKVSPPTAPDSVAIIGVQTINAGSKSDKAKPNQEQPEKSTGNKAS